MFPSWSLYTYADITCAIIVKGWLHSLISPFSQATSTLPSTVFRGPSRWLAWVATESMWRLAPASLPSSAGRPTCISWTSPMAMSPAFKPELHSTGRSGVVLWVLLMLSFLMLKRRMLKGIFKFECDNSTHIWHASIPALLRSGAWRARLLVLKKQRRCNYACACTYAYTHLIHMHVYSHSVDDDDLNPPFFIKHWLVHGLESSIACWCRGLKLRPPSSLFIAL